MSDHNVSTLDGRPSAFARGVFVANLIAQMGIVVTGAIVRVTSSGLGCPTWPRCTAGSFVPVDGQPEQWHKYVEFGNRSLTFILGVLALTSIAVAFMDRRHRSRTGLNPFVVAAHFLLSLVLIALLTNLVVSSREQADQPITLRTNEYIRKGVWLLSFLMASVLVLGTLVTASGPHAGDAHVQRTGWDPQLVSWIHADLVLLCVGLTVGLLVSLFATNSPRDIIGAGALALVLFLSQGLIGYVQYFTGLPWLVVVCHVLGAVIVWWATVRFLLTTRRRGAAI